MFTSKILTLFLGNHDVTVQTVRETLRVMDEEQLAEQFDAAFVIRGERAFDQRLAEENATSTMSFDRSGPAEALDIVKPTYMFPRALLDQIGSLDALERFFVHVEDTFLSRNHLFRLDWCWVLGNAIAPNSFHELLCAALSSGARPAEATAVAPVRELLEYICEQPSPARTQLLFHPPHDRRRVASRAADIAVHAVLDSRSAEVARVLDLLEIPQQPRGRSALSPYRLTVHLYERFERTEQVWQHVERALGHSRDGVERLALAVLLERNGVDLSPARKPFFVAPAHATTPRDAQSRAVREEYSS
jgi:hypothetical protein